MTREQLDLALLDDLADTAGGYVSPPTAEDLEYTDLLFDVAKQFGIHYYSASPVEKNFVEEVTRVTWEIQQKKRTGKVEEIRPAFTA